MSFLIKSFHEISERGEVIYPEWRKDNLGSNFKVRLIIGSMWEFNGKRIEKNIPIVIR